MKLLVVIEDDEVVRSLIEVLLRQETSFEIISSATTADEAISDAKETQPDLVILDHFIDGDIMGLELAPMLKTVAPQMKILLFTSHDLEFEAKQEPAIDAYLSKANMNDLLPTVRQLAGVEKRK